MFRKKHSFIVAVVTVVSFKVLTFLYGIEQVSMECFTSLCDWFRKLAQLSQPIRCKTKTNHDLVARVFPRLGSLVFALSSHWLLKVFSCLSIGCCDYLGLVLRHSIEKRFVSFRWFFMDRSNRFFSLNFFSAIFVLYYLFFVSLVSVLLLLQLNLTNLHHSFQFVVSLKPFFQWDWRF